MIPTHLLSEFDCMLYIRLLTPSVITIIIIIIIIIIVIQRAKKVVSNSPGLVDFAIGLVNSVWIILRNSTYRRTVKPILFIKKFWGLVEMMFGLVNVSFSLPEWQAVKMTFFAPCYSHHHHFNHTVIIFMLSYSSSSSLSLSSSSSSSPSLTTLLSLPLLLKS